MFYWRLSWPPYFNSSSSIFNPSPQARNPFFGSCSLQLSNQPFCTANNTLLLHLIHFCIRTTPILPPTPLFLQNHFHLFFLFFRWPNLIFNTPSPSHQTQHSMYVFTLSTLPCYFRPKLTLLYRIKPLSLRAPSLLSFIGPFSSSSLPLVLLRTSLPSTRIVLDWFSIGLQKYVFSLPLFFFPNLHSYSTVFIKSQHPRSPTLFLSDI